jgi:hypothetical protein
MDSGRQGKGGNDNGLKMAPASGSPEGGRPFALRAPLHLHRPPLPPTRVLPSVAALRTRPGAGTFARPPLPVQLARHYAGEVFSPYEKRFQKDFKSVDHVSRAGIMRPSPATAGSFFNKQTADRCGYWVVGQVVVLVWRYCEVRSGAVARRSPEGWRRVVVIP